MSSFIRSINSLFRVLGALDFIAPLAFRLMLAYVFWHAGWAKISDGGISPGFVSLIAGMGLPAPALFAWLAALSEIIGSGMLLLGVGVRWAAVPLMGTMLVAIFGVHWDNGWLAIASGAESEISCRLQRVNEIINLYGRPDWLRAEGSFVILNNGIQFGVIYLSMLASLFFTGGGKLVSADYWLKEYVE